MPEIIQFPGSSDEGSNDNQKSQEDNLRDIKPQIIKELELANILNFDVLQKDREQLITFLEQAHDKSTELQTIAVDQYSQAAVRKELLAELNEMYLTAKQTLNDPEDSEEDSFLSKVKAVLLPSREESGSSEEAFPQSLEPEISNTSESEIKQAILELQELLRSNLEGQNEWVSLKNHLVTIFFSSPQMHYFNRVSLEDGLLIETFIKNNFDALHARLENYSRRNLNRSDEFTRLVGVFNKICNHLDLTQLKI